MLQVSLQIRVGEGLFVLAVPVAFLFGKRQAQEITLEGEGEAGGDAVWHGQTSLVWQHVDRHG